jgi:hypothetical protein
MVNKTERRLLGNHNIQGEAPVEVEKERPNNLASEMKAKYEDSKMQSRSMRVSTKPSKVRKDIRESVEAYIEKHSQYKKLERELAALREPIEAYMKEHNLKELESEYSDIRIAIESSDRPVCNSRYTTYLVEDVEPFINTRQDKAQAIVKVVDKEVLEFLVKMGKVDEDVLKLKQLTTVNSFVVKK